MIKRLSVYYAAANCEACGAGSHWGELIAVLVPEIIFTGYDSAKVIKHYKHICPSCYLSAVKRSKTPTCLTNPDRLNELLERYKEE